MLEWLTNTQYAVWVRESWGWPFALTLHAFGNVPKGRHVEPIVAGRYGMPNQS